MPIDPIKIPQNVYIEDRIVGPLTLKQVIIVAIGCGFSYAMYAMVTKQFGAVSIPLTVMIWVPGLLSMVFAFVKINDLSMMKICFLTLERINKPSTRTWSPRRGIAINIRTFQAPDQTQSHNTRLETAKKKPQHIDELSDLLDLPEPEDMLDTVATPAAEETPTVRPVNPSRVSASPLNADISMDTVAAPVNGSVSIFRDLSPHA